LWRHAPWSSTCQARGGSAFKLILTALPHLSPRTQPHAKTEAKKSELTYPSNHLTLAGSSGSIAASALILSNRPRAAAVHMSIGMMSRGCVCVWVGRCERDSESIKPGSLDEMMTSPRGRGTYVARSPKRLCESQKAIYIIYYKQGKIYTQTFALLPHFFLLCIFIVPQTHTHTLLCPLY